MGGGAWPFLVRGVISLVNSVNERHLNQLNSHMILRSWDWRYHGFIDTMYAEKLTKLDCLGEIKVGERFP